MITIKNISATIATVAILTVGVQANSAEQLEGTWKSVGYGQIMDFKNGNAQIYHVTDISCSKGEAYPSEITSHMINRIDATEAGKISFYQGGGITRYDFTKLPALPAKCDEGLNTDPEYNFDVFWHAFNDQYAFFELHGVDWDAAYKKYRPQVTKDTTPKELFDILIELQTILKDGHVSLHSPDIENENVDTDLLGTISMLIRKEPGDIPYVYTPEGKKKIKDIINTRYLKNSKKFALIEGEVVWGWAAKGIGYISVDDMYGFVPDPETASGIERRDAVDRLMDQILTDFEGAKGIIVDTRWNGGGYDEISLTIAGHFTDKSLIAFTKKARLGDSFTPKQQVFIPTHARKKFTGPIAFLRGSDSFSATEIFSMAMQAIPNVTSIGESTGGGLSDILGFAMPNGWGIGMSNEVYTAIDGKVYEHLGIPVDITVPEQEGDTLESYLARGMDTAIELINKQ